MECGVSLFAWFFQDIGVSSGTIVAEERLFYLCQKGFHHRCRHEMQ